VRTQALIAVADREREETRGEETRGDERRERKKER
jgi:hypothetical protein